MKQDPSGIEPQKPELCVFRRHRAISPALRQNSGMMISWLEMARKLTMIAEIKTGESLDGY